MFLMIYWNANFFLNHKITYQLFTICTSPKTYLICNPKFCISIVLYFSRDHCNTLSIYPKEYRIEFPRIFLLKMGLEASLQSEGIRLDTFAPLLENERLKICNLQRNLPPFKWWRAKKEGFFAPQMLQKSTEKEWRKRTKSEEKGKKAMYGCSLNWLYFGNEKEAFEKTSGTIYKDRGKNWPTRPQ